MGKTDIKNKKLVVFDLDGTLTPSKQPMDSEMSNILVELLRKKSVAVIGGGSYKQFQNQFLPSLNCPKELLQKLFMFPTCSTSFYRYMSGGWRNVYTENLKTEDKKKILDAFKKALDQYGYKPEKLYGEMIEDRVTQITFSALGQEAPLELKEKWDPDCKKRIEIKAKLDKLIPEFEVRMGGTTSIDVTRKSINKAYGIKKIQEILGFSISEMLFIGDALYEGGNDYPVKETGVETVQVSGPGDCKKLIKDIIR